MGRHNPFEELEELFERMSGQFEGTEWYKIGNQPVMVDLVDLGEAFELTADLPGFARDDIDISLADGTLTIEANREESTTDEETEEPVRYLRQERRSAAVSRSIRLPEPIEEESAKATYNAGVLTVSLPKLEPDQDGTSIDIE